MKVTMIIEDDYGQKVTNENIIEREQPLPEILRVVKGTLLAGGFEWIDEVLIRKKDDGDEISSEDWDI